MNLGVRVSGFSAVMLKPARSEISEETHTHRRMTLERMMLDRFVLTGGFELPCFRLWAEWMCTSVRLCVRVCGGAHTVRACMHLQHRCAGPLVYAWPSHSWSSTPMPFGAVWWEDEKKKQGMKWTTEGLSISLPPERWTRTISPGPGSPAWRPLNPSLCLRPFMFHHAHRHRTPPSLASFHPPFTFISFCQPCTRLQAKFTSPGAANTRLRHTGTYSRPHTHQRWY